LNICIICLRTVAALVAACVAWSDLAGKPARDPRRRRSAQARANRGNTAEAIARIRLKIERTILVDVTDQEKPMRRRAIARAVVGLCVTLAGAALADSNSLVGRWHWNHAQSTAPSGEPVPNDVIVEISRVDSTHVKWSLTVLAAEGRKNVEAFDSPANGEFYPVSRDTTAAFRLGESSLQVTFKGTKGETDSLTCSVAADRNKMTCRGTLIDGGGRTTSYVDVYDRL
jgi:hypothetical protein